MTLAGSVAKLKGRLGEPKEIASLILLRFYRDAFLAITDFTFYRRLFQQRLLKTFVYLALLVLNAAALETLLYSWTVLPSVERFLEWVEENFPPLEFKDGQLTIQGDQPIVRQYFADQIHTFVFDTSGPVEGLYKYNQPVYALTRDSLRVLSEGDPQTYQWAPLLQLADEQLGKPSGSSRRVDREDWANVRRALPYIFCLSTFLGLLLLLGVALLIQALLLTFFGMSASLRLGVRLPFSQYFSIAIYSLTPAATLHLIVPATGQDAPYYELIGLATAAIYAYKATQKCVVVE